MQKNLKFIIGLLLPIIIAQGAFAQLWPGPHPLFSPNYKLSVDGNISSQVDTLEKKFGYEKAEGSFSIPLYTGKDWLTSTGNTPLIGVTLQGKASVLQPEGGFLEKDMRLFRGRLGGNLIYSSGLRNLYMLNVQGIIARELKSFNFSGIYINGSAFWRYRKNDQFGWTLGLLYTSSFGKNRILPLAGFNYRPTKEDLISVLLPSFIQYTHFLSNAKSVSVAIKPNGGFYTLNFPVNDSVILKDIIFRHRNILISGTFHFKLSYQLTIEPEAGWQSNTRLFIDENKYTATSSLFAKIMIRYKFGQRANVAPILDFDPTDFTTSDPEIPEN